MNKIAIITGATSGIGKATALTFAANKFDLIITGRRKDRLEETAKELESTQSIRVLPIALDVQDKAAVFSAFQDLPAEWQAIDVLVNNAGLALGRDLFDEASMDDWETMLDTNVKGLLYVSKAVLPYMIARRHGHIVNLGSIAGKQAYEKGNVYCASKAAVHMLSQTMRVDLLRHKIRVTSINPGAAETEFGLVRFKGDEETAKKVYEGYQPLSPDDIAGIIHYCTSLPPHVCINDLDVTCTAQASAFYTFKE